MATNHDNTATKRAKASGKNLLTDTAIKGTKIKEKDYLLPDGGGLYLNIKTIGTKVWTIRYSINGKAKKTTLGNYPTVTLALARTKRDEFMALVAQSIDPIENKKTQKQVKKIQEEFENIQIAGQFHLVVYRWLDAIKNKYDEKTHTKRVRAFERDILPHFSEYDENRNITRSKHISQITHSDLLAVIQEKEKTAAETAHRLLTDCNRVWLFAISENHATFNITANISKQDALQKHHKKHYPKITDEKILSELLNSIDAYHGQAITRQALRLVCYLPLRAENLCALKWEWVDFEKEIITIPRVEMKIKNKNLPDFKLPIPHQAIEILKETQKLTGWGVWVFHGVTNFQVHLGKETLNKALRLMGFNDEAAGRKQTTHSFRGTFRSLTETYAQMHGVSFEAREAALDHQEAKGAVRAYTHKADYTEQIKPLMQWWADYLDGLRGAVDRK